MNNLTENQLAEIALTHNLFVEGWQMKNLYKTMEYGGLGLHLLTVENEPVAACILYIEDCMINVYVKEEHRGKGYGKKVIDQTLEKYQKTIYQVYGCSGMDGSEKFYNKCGVAYFADGCFSMIKEEMPLLVNNQITMEQIKDKRIAEYLDNLEKSTQLAKKTTARKI